jgi:5-methylcytosine-specific restriction enzyme A
MNTTIHGGYQHVEPQLGEYVHGDGKLGDAPIQSDGQWDAFLPNVVAQNSNGFEPYCCVSESVEHSDDTLKIKQYGDTNKSSIRWLAKITGTDIRQGNDMQTVCEARRVDGYVLESDYSFVAASFDIFYQTLTKALTILGLSRGAQYAYGHSWVNANPADMKAALTYSPLSAAGYAWQQDPTTGYYITPAGSIPEHAFMVYGYVDGQYWKVLDSYPDETGSYTKKLAWDYQFTGIKRHTINRQITNPSAFQSFLAWISVVVDQVQNTFGLGRYGNTFGAARSSKWPEVEKAFLAQHPTCAVCGSMKDRNVHHRQPFHVKPELELEPTNLITLCRTCHFLIGHLKSWKSWNVNVEEDSSHILGEVKSRP